MTPMTNGQAAVDSYSGQAMASWSHVGYPGHRSIILPLWTYIGATHTYLSAQYIRNTYPYVSRRPTHMQWYFGLKK